MPSGYTDEGRTDTRAMQNAGSEYYPRVNWGRKTDTSLKYVPGYGYVSETREPDYRQIAAAQEKKAMLANKAKNPELTAEPPLKKPTVKVGAFGTIWNKDTVKGGWNGRISNFVKYYNVPENQIDRPDLWD